jgi:hypothetical protein
MFVRRFLPLRDEGHRHNAAELDKAELVKSKLDGPLQALGRFVFGEFQGASHPWIFRDYVPPNGSYGTE